MEKCAIESVIANMEEGICVPEDIVIDRIYYGSFSMENQNEACL